LALDATVNIVGPAGERSLDIADFFLGVGENALKKDEMLTEIRLPAFPARTGSAFMKKGRLAACDLAIVNVTVRLTMSDDSICQEARIALGAVAPVPLRAKAAEAMLRGEKLQDKIISNAATQVVQLIKPISDIRSSAEYRKILSCVLVERALKEAATKLS
jgi:carbon-monoxide dehydrogenase medium subunit